MTDQASKVLSRRRGDDVSRDGEGSVSDAEESRPARQGIDVRLPYPCFFWLA